MNRLRIILIFVTIINACSSDQKHAGKPPQISIVAVRKTIVQMQRVFLGYSESAERVSWFDADDLLEKAHIRIGGKVLSVHAMASLDAVAIVQPTSLTVIDSSSAELKFNIPDQRKTENWASSSDVAAYAFVSVDSTSMKIVRYLGESTWQDETFSLPTAFAGKETSVFIAKSGLHAMVIEKKTGSYVIYSAVGPDTNITASPLECLQTSDLPFNVESTFLHANSSRLFIGGPSGTIKSFLPFANATCVTTADWLDSSMTNQQDVVGMFAPGADSLGVVFDETSGARLFAVTTNSVTLKDADGIVAGLDCERMVDAVKLGDAITGLAGASLYLSICRESSTTNIFSIKISGELADGTVFNASFDETLSVEDIGAIAVDTSAGEVFIQTNDARGHVAKLKPDAETLRYQTVRYDGMFLHRFFDY